MPETAADTTASAVTTVPDSITAAQALSASARTVPDGFKGSERICILDKAPVMPRPDRDAYTSEARGWQTGLEGHRITPLAGYDSGVMALMLATLIVVSFNFRHYSSFIKSFTADLWSVRRRSNIFDDPTVNERGVMLSLILLVTVAEGALLYAWMNVCGLWTGSPASGLIITVSGAMAYYIWQLAAYRTVGFTFGTSNGSSQWIRGFNASQALLGLTLIVPAMLALFYPGGVFITATLGISLYFIARIVFIVKGFRIFYTGVSSLLYFILYLCTLEITPLIVAWRLLNGEITLV